MVWQRMLFLGDSLTHGSRDPYGLAWPYYLARHAQSGVGDHKLVILPHVDAVPGRTSSELLRSALPTIEAAAARDTREVCILIGTNDAKDEVDLPALIYRANIQLLVSWCRVVGMRVYLLTIPVPSGFGSPGYTVKVGRRIESFNHVLRESFSDADGVALVECSDVDRTVDGVHLTASASAVIAGRVWHTLLTWRVHPGAGSKMLHPTSGVVQTADEILAPGGVIT